MQCDLLVTCLIKDGARNRGIILVLMSLLTQLIPCPKKSKPLICMLASQILKSRHPQLGLVQRVVSVLLYGNSTAKQASFVFTTYLRNYKTCVYV